MLASNENGPSIVGRQTPSLEIRSVHVKYVATGDQSIAESDLERTLRHQPAHGRRPDERCQFVLRCDGCDHVGRACRVLVHQQRYVTVMTLASKDSVKTATERPASPNFTIRGSTCSFGDGMRSNWGNLSCRNPFESR
jgi:hypothetical protein